MVKLIHNLLVDVSQHNYTLMLDKHKQDKKGKPMYDTLGYYSTLGNAINGAKEYCIRKCLSDNICNLNDAINTIKQVTNEFSVLLKETVGE